MPHVFRLIVIGASGGSIEALKRVLNDLPTELPAAVAVVLHTHATSPRYMADILNKHSSLPVAYATNRDELILGRVYLAPPDTHLVIQQTHRLGLFPGSKVNFHRPAIDPLFTSAARVFGIQVIGVLLTGGDGDGSIGLQEVKKEGGISVLQSPADAFVPDRRIRANFYMSPDYVLPLDRLGPLLKNLVAA